MANQLLVVNFGGDSHSLVIQGLNSDPDVLDSLIKDKRSPTTKREYAKDVRDFFQRMYTAKIFSSQEATPENVRSFLRLCQVQATTVVLKYKSLMVDAKLSENTINRRLAALKSLVRMGRKLGVCNFTLDEISSEKVKAYRDTSGIDASQFKKVLETCSRSTLIGKRDYAILRLLWGNVLRRGEVVELNIGHLDLAEGKLSILGKGQGSQREWVNLGAGTLSALADWLQARGVAAVNEPLFIALDRAYWGHRLSDTSIASMVKTRSKKAGITKRVTPHRLRHSGITQALQDTNGDVRRVQKLSRHADLRTLTIYDDNRKKYQKEITDLLDSLV